MCWFFTGDKKFVPLMLRLRCEQYSREHVGTGGHVGGKQTAAWLQQVTRICARLPVPRLGQVGLCQGLMRPGREAAQQG